MPLSSDISIYSAILESEKPEIEYGQYDTTEPPEYSG